MHFAIKIKKNSNRSTKSVIKVFKKARKCYREGMRFDSARKTGSGGHNILILAGSVEEQLVADTIESGGSIRDATYSVNEYRMDTLGALHVGETCVRNAIYRLNPDIRKTGKRACSSKNIEWQKCRCNWSMQLGLRTGAWTWDNSSGPPPDHFNIDKIGGVIPLSAIAWWDETSKRCKLDGSFGRNISIVFPRDKNGALDPNGTYNEHRTEMTVKYTQHADFVLGVAMVEMGGEFKGIRLEPIEYTGMWMHTIESFEKQRGQVWAWAKDHGSARKFITGSRPPKGPSSKLYELDSVTRIPNVGPTKAKSLLESFNIETVVDLKNCPSANVSESIRNAAENALHGAYSDDNDNPKVVDH